MQVKSCRECKNLFQHIDGKAVCPKCLKRHEEILNTIKEYLYENKNATFKMLHEELNIPLRLIEEFVREGRLEISKGSPLCVTCDICGTRITSGKMCDDCRNEMLGEVSKVGKESKPQKENEKKQEKKKTTRMHVHH